MPENKNEGGKETEGRTKHAAQGHLALSPIPKPLAMKCGLGG